MPLSAGEKLGPYEILIAIGAGGMGEVYKARDSRLNRTVAVKVLPEHIARREDLRARFEREARAVASLNHPNICVLHDIGNQNGAGYIVMEYIEGETLAARIEKGALPLDQALKLATQIADALDRAHRAGVTHRDVKPQNVMLTRDGVKVLDFGLAKSGCLTPGSKPGPAEETLTKALTAEGTVIGTPQYMPPEQFEGKEADARSDIWAFGAVLYEMVTGQKAFQGKSHASLVGAILSADPAPMAVKPFTPAWLERLVRRCLAKDPEDRWQTMRDVVIELRAPPQESAAGPSKAVPWPWVVAGVSVLALIVASGGWYNSASRPEPPHPLIRVTDELGPEWASGPVGTDGLMAISPDGSRIAVILLDPDNHVRIHTRLLQQTKLTQLADTENAGWPFFSPDGQWIGFAADGKLKKIPVDGGAAVTICDAPLIRGASWGGDGNIVVALGYSFVLFIVPSTGGAPTPLTRLKELERSNRWPQVLPGSQAVLFSSIESNNIDDANIDVVSVKIGARKTVLKGGYSPHYAVTSLHSGSLLYVRKNTMFAAPFDSDSLTVTGPSVPVLEEVSANIIAGGNFALSSTGTLIFKSGHDALPSNRISLIDGAGNIKPLQADAGSYSWPRVSPDGRRIAFSKERTAGGNAADIWVKDLDRETPSRLTVLAGLNTYPVWTPDSKNIIFRSTGTSNTQGFYWVRANGAGQAQRLSSEESSTVSYSISPDGNRLLFSKPGHSGSQDIFTRQIGGDPDHPTLGKPELFLGTAFLEAYPAISPDGRWIAYVSDESGTTEIYVRPFPGPGSPWRISSGGGSTLKWTKDGHELFYLAADGRVMAVSYRTSGDTFTAAKPRVWSEVRLTLTHLLAEFDVTPDGKQIVVVLPEKEEKPKPENHLTILLNFFGELGGKAPAGK